MEEGSTNHQISKLVDEILPINYKLERNQLRTYLKRRIYEIAETHHKINNDMDPNLIK